MEAGIGVEAGLHSRGNRDRAADGSLVMQTR